MSSAFTISTGKSRRPRILYIVSSWPRGRSFGGQIRALHIGRALQQLGDTTLLVVSSDAADLEARRQSEIEFKIEPPVLPEISLDRSIRGKARRALSVHHMNLHGFVAPSPERDRVAQLIPQFDLVWVLNSRTPNILQIWQWPRSHLDLDDVPSTYWRAMAQKPGAPWLRWKAALQQRLQLRRELRFKSRFTTLSVCSREDRAYLGNSEQVHVIPNGFSRPAEPPVRRLDAAHPRIGFIGLYSYPPNLEGMQWFLTECWPAIRREVPAVRLRLVGKDTDGPLRPKEPQVDALGWVADPADEIATWSAMIIPIRLGGGTRIKLAEAFSRKCPAVATPLGAFGYEVKDGKQIRLANEAPAFALACVDLLRNPSCGMEMAEEAWNDFLAKWTWDAITPKVHRAAEDCLRRSSGK